MTIKKLKRKSISWIDAKIWEYANEDKKLTHFWKFECSEFFRGEITAELNKEYYYKRKSFIDRKVRQLKLLKQNVDKTSEIIGQFTKAKELLKKWVELFKPKGGNIPPTPIQVETEQFLNSEV